MWRRRLSTLSRLRSLPQSLPYSFISQVAPGSSTCTSSFRDNLFIFSRHFSLPSAAKNVDSSKKTIDDIKKEELEALLDGRQVQDVDYPEGPFGTKESPAIIQSYYDKKIIGCPGPEGDDEHDIEWFVLEKGKPCECPVCSQYFMMEVVGPGGDPDGHTDGDQH